MFKPSPFGWVSQYFMGFFFTYGVYLPFWALWFASQGVSSADIGILVGIGFATRCVANLVLTPRLHNIEQVMPALRLLALIGFIVCSLHFFTSGNFWLMALATVAFNACFGPSLSLSDSLANYYGKINLLDYGKARLWGSIAFIVGSTVVGYLVEGYGSDMILYSAMAGLLLTLVFACRSPKIMPVAEVTHHSNRPKVMSLLSQWRVIKFLVLVALIQGSHAAYYSFSAIYWKEAGHTEGTIGFLWSLAVVAEVLVFAFSGRVFANWSLRAMFMVASLGVMMRWTGLAMSTEFAVLVVVQLLHGVTFALTHFATIRYIQREDSNKIVPMQALYNAIPMGAFVAMTTAFSGWGFELWQGNIFWIMAAMGALALFIKLDEEKAELEPQIQSK